MQLVVADVELDEVQVANAKWERAGQLVSVSSIASQI